MIRRVAVLLCAALLLAACGSITATQALTSWVKQSNFQVNSRSIVTDARHSATALRRTNATSADLHTLCAVLLDEVNQINASLPTPDAQTTALLSKSYTDLGAAANLCYRAGASTSARSRAVAKLTLGVSLLSEGLARVATLSPQP